MGSVQYYTIQRFTPALTGRKECRGTLFPASVTRELGVKIVWGYTKVNARVLLGGNSVGVHSFLPV